MCNPQEEQIRKGPWSVEEDMLLLNYIAFHGEGRWNFLAQAAGLKRTGKSCRLRWVNYLRPDLKRGNIAPEEERLIIDLQSRWGNRWSRIARYLPGRTDNEIKNHWRTKIKRKLLRGDSGGNRFIQNSICSRSMPETKFLQQNSGGMKDMAVQAINMHETLNKPIDLPFNEVKKQEYSVDVSNSITVSNGVNNMSADSSGLVEGMGMGFEVDSIGAMFSEIYEDHFMDVGETSKLGFCSYPHTYPSLPSPDRYQMEPFLQWAYQA